MRIYSMIRPEIIPVRNVLRLMSYREIPRIFRSEVSRRFKEYWRLLILNRVWFIECSNWGNKERKINVITVIMSNCCMGTYYILVQFIPQLWLIIGSLWLICFHELQPSAELFSVTTRRVVINRNRQWKMARLCSCCDCYLTYDQLSYIFSYFELPV